MKFISSRNITLCATLSEAILCGLAKDGGLFLPEGIPKISLGDFNVDLSFPEFAQKVLQPYFAGDFLSQYLGPMCQDAFHFPVPLSQLNSDTWMLELFHGPTSSFKDFGARFLAECMQHLAGNQKTTILVATSGDTGSAVASAFYKKSKIQVIILYPKGQISSRQEHQITCWDDNIRALAVDGNFDDCQKLVKTAFQDPWCQKQLHLSSANSINIGRLLPQISYYAYSSMHFYRTHNIKPGYVVPTGNLGNATAGYIAQLMGFPIRELVLATNANRVLPDYLETGEFHPRDSIATLANAMDVGNPSNFERLHYLFNTFEAFKSHVQAYCASDEDIKNTIKSTYQESQIILCPHTATACFARKKFSQEPWIVVATADPSKFETVLNPLLQVEIPIAKQLQTLLERPVQKQIMNNSLMELKKILQES